MLCRVLPTHLHVQASQSVWGAATSCQLVLSSQLMTRSQHRFRSICVKALTPCNIASKGENERPTCSRNMTSPRPSGANHAVYQAPSIIAQPEESCRRAAAPNLYPHACSSAHGPGGHHKKDDKYAVLQDIIAPGRHRSKDSNIRPVCTTCPDAENILILFGGSAKAKIR